MGPSPTAVAVFAFNRPNHVAQLIDSLRSAHGARDATVFFFSDGPRAHVPADQQKVTAVRRVVAAAVEGRDFSRIHVVEQSRNLGLARSVIMGVSRVLEAFESVIVLEDDLVLAKGALRFMVAGLGRYKADPHAFSVTAYRYGEGGPSARIGFAPRFSSWAWGTWRDRWHRVDWDVRDYARFAASHHLRASFNRGGDDLADMLDAQLRGQIDSWAIRMNYAQWKAGGLTLFPARSLVENRGFDGSGVHCGVDDLPHGQASSASEDTFDFPARATLDPVIAQEISRAHRYVLRVRVGSELRWLARRLKLAS